jgi:hypothetical protein
MTGAARRQSNWTPEEDRRLLELVEAHKSWVFISEPQAACQKRSQPSCVPAPSLLRMQQTFLEIFLIQSVRPILTAIVWLKHRAPLQNLVGKLEVEGSASDDDWQSVR